MEVQSAQAPDRRRFAIEHPDLEGTGLITTFNLEIDRAHCRPVYITKDIDDMYNSQAFAVNFKSMIYLKVTSERWISVSIASMEGKRAR